MDLYLMDELVRGHGTYIVGARKEYFYGYMRNPSQEDSYEAIREWSRKATDNMLSLNDEEYPPQIIVHGSIQEAKLLDGMASEICKSLKVNPADVAIPFIGGIPGYSFPELYKRWRESKQKGLYSLVEIYKTYMTELIKADIAKAKEARSVK